MSGCLNIWLIYYKRSHNTNRLPMEATEAKSFILRKIKGDFSSNEFQTKCGSLKWQFSFNKLLLLFSPK